MGETRRKFDADFRGGAVRLVRETDKRRRGDGDGALDEDERAELARLRKRER